MIYTVTKLTEKVSKFGGKYIRVEFIDIDNRHYYTCLDPRKKNYHRWIKVVNVGVSFKGLEVKEGKLINADSKFEVIGR